MLRTSVELKAANPERVLLYRLSDCFECICKEGAKRRPAAPAASTASKLRLAGVPTPVVQRARQVLDQLAA